MKEEVQIIIDCKTMYESFMLDLPPVPDCFSKLLVGDEVASSAVASQPWRKAERLREMKDHMLKSLAEESVPETKCVVNGDCSQHERSLSINEDSEIESDPETQFADHHDAGHSPVVSQPDTSNPAYYRLNSSLSTLKQQMVSILAVSLLLYNFVTVFPIIVDRGCVHFVREYRRPGIIQPYVLL
jgi:hypothetical protein